MKICFIRLPMTWAENQFADPSLGLLYTIATTRNAGHDVEFFDMGLSQDPTDADVYGISATSLEYSEACRTARSIKEWNPEAITVLGGVHASLELEEVDPSIFDVRYVGEGEDFPYLLDAIKNGNVPRVFIGKVQKDLNALPFPARDLLDKKYFHSGTIFHGDQVGNGVSATIITSRGCPFTCSFCASPFLWNRKVRWRSAGNVLAEIDHLQSEYGVGELRFQDDNMTLNKRFLKSLCLQLKDREVFWRCSTRADLVNPELLKILWEGGCREIGFGVESGDDAVLDVVNKKVRTIDLLRGIRLAREAGFRIRVFLMTGLPGEGPDTADKTIDFLNAANPSLVTLCTFMPIPGSDISYHPDKYDGEILLKDLGKLDIALKWEKGEPFGFKPNGISIDAMEENREKLKRYIFNSNMSNVFSYNRAYQ